MKTILLLLLATSLGQNIIAQDFVYRPKNPAFGGDTFNYQWMLSSAQAQNSLEEDDGGRDPLEDFQTSLNRQILSQLSRQLVNAQFGEDGLTEGTFVVEDFQVQVTPTTDGISIVILDFATGNQTSIVIPFF